ncbi:Protein kinase domain [Asimina triloba]
MRLSEMTKASGFVRKSGISYGGFAGCESNLIMRLSEMTKASGFVRKSGISYGGFAGMQFKGSDPVRATAQYLKVESSAPRNPQTACFFIPSAPGSLNCLEVRKASANLLRLPQEKTRTLEAPLRQERRLHSQSRPPTRPPNTMGAEPDEPPPPPPLDLRDLRALSVLGRGAKGVAFLVRTTATSSHTLLALKAISKSHIDKKKKNKLSPDDAYRRIWFERDVLTTLRHPLLPALRASLETDKIVGFAIPFCPGGNLAALRHKQTEQMFSDDIIRFYAAELVLALEYLHRLGIVYRDLKPENILIQEDGHLMLVDFDLSKKISAKSSRNYALPIPSRAPEDRDKQIFAKTKKNKRRIFPFCSRNRRTPSSNLFIAPAAAGDDSVDSPAGSRQSDSPIAKSNSFVGTEDYVAPEIIQGNGHDFAVDWWSLGVVLYEMLYGRTPFRGSNRKETFYRILTKAPELVGEQTQLRDLIGRLLEKEPEQRISVEGVKRHRFFRGVDWEKVVEIARPPYIPEWRGEWEEEEGNPGIEIEQHVERIFEDGEGREKRSKSEWVEAVGNHHANTSAFAIF